MTAGAALSHSIPDHLTRIVTGTLPGDEFRIEAGMKGEFLTRPREWKAAFLGRFACVVPIDRN